MSLVTTRVARQLGLVVDDSPVPLYGIGGIQVKCLTGQALITFSSIKSSAMRIKTFGLVMDTIAGWQPSTDVPPWVSSLVSGLDLADPFVFHPGPVDLLLGSDVLGWILTGTQRVLGSSSLMAVSTIFGSALMGPIFESGSMEESTLAAPVSLAKTMQRFWEVEEPPMASRMDPEHAECEAFYQSNTGRLPSGRFVTRLPFVSSRPSLGQ